MSTPAALSRVADEWDEIGPVRHRLIAEGRDISFSNVLAPYALRFVDTHKPDRLLDAGCGTGDLASLIGARAGSIVGVDVSAASIALARECNARANISYHQSSIERFAAPAQSFDSCVANMLLMDTPHARSVVRAFARLLKTGGTLMVTVLHPAFYHRFADAYDPIDDYLRERQIVGQFHTTLAPDQQLTRTHWHRPTQFYLRILLDAGFALLSLDELAPPRSIHNMYAGNGALPRFLGIVCRRVENAAERVSRA